MMKFAIATILAAGLAMGSIAGVHAKLPAAPAMTAEQKAAAAAKASAAKAKTAEANARAMEKAVANYKMGKGMAVSKP